MRERHPFVPSGPKGRGVVCARCGHFEATTEIGLCPTCAKTEAVNAGLRTNRGAALRGGLAGFIYHWWNRRKFGKGEWPPPNLRPAEDARRSDAVSPDDAARVDRALRDFD